MRFVQVPAGHDLLAELATFAGDGAVKPVVHQIYPLSGIAAAHESVQSGGGFGKRVIQIT